MGNPNLLDQAVRVDIIKAIKGSENRARKLNEQRKHDIYRKRQAGYVLERLRDEFDPKTVEGMRKVLSINPCKRIIDEQASLYVDEPKRHWVNASEDEAKQLDKIYECGINPQFRLSNRWFKLHGQASLYAVPKDGCLKVRALTPKDYDVIPDADDPEKAFAYILNVMDVDLARTAPADNQATRSAVGYDQNDRANEIIADRNDSKAEQERYVFWTAETHFTCNGKGDIVSDAHVNDDGTVSPVQPNPISRLPFVDIAPDKDFTFFVQVGSDAAEFVIDLLVQLSDLATTTRYQNYSQAVVSSTEEPKAINVGPNKVLWMKQDPTGQAPPATFTFVSPTPDIMGSLEVINVQLKMFLSSQGLNPGTVSGKNEVEKFMSGIDHLLANLDKFKASKEDMDTFRQAERELFEVIKAWHGVMKDVTGPGELDDDFTQVNIGDDTEIDIVYHEPQAIMTDSETEDYCIKAVEAGLMTLKEAVKRMYKVDDDKAEEIVEELKSEKAERVADAQAAMTQGMTPDGKPLPMAPGQDPNAPNAQGMDGNGKPGAPVVKLPKEPKPLTKEKEA